MSISKKLTNHKFRDKDIQGLIQGIDNSIELQITKDCETILLYSKDIIILAHSLGFRLFKETKISPYYKKTKLEEIIYND